MEQLRLRALLKGPMVKSLFRPQSKLQTHNAHLVLTCCLIDKYKCTTTPDQVFSITPRLQGHVELLKNVSSMHETVLWQPASPDQITINAEVHLFIPASSQKQIIQLLQRYDITHRVLLANAQELIEAQKRNHSSDPRSSTSYYERYHPLEDIYHWIDKTSREYSERLQVILIGSSVEKQPLFVLKLSGIGHQPKKAIWMDCGIHAREWISPAFCMWFVQYSVMNYNQHSDITEILDKMDIYVLPVMNPDGYKYSWIENRMWRKNRSRNVDSACVGTDLNRNFDANWCTKGSSDNPCDETYCGRFPESEPEAAAVSNFIRSKKDLVKLYLSIHSYSQMLIFPYSCSYQEAPNHQELYEIAREAAMKIKIHYKNNYKFGAGAKSFYLAPGGSDDWAYNLGIDYSFTFELQDNGRYGFLLPPSHISKACSEALTAVKSIALSVIKKRHFS